MSNLTLVMKSLYGSKLYGTNVATSDDDFKGIYLPTLDQLVSGQEGVINDDYPATEDQAKIENQYFSIKYYMELLLSGQTVAMDMLFTPKEFLVETSLAWDLMQLNRDKFVSRNVMPFVGYARGQAIKYGEKGDRLRTVLDFEKEVNNYVDMMRFEEGTDNLPCDPDWFTGLVVTFKDRDGVKLKTETKNGTTVRMIEVVGKAFGDTTHMKLWLMPLQKLVSSFGKRATEAMTTDGHDLKAQYHCFRIIEEARELLNTGAITFPRPERDTLLSIRRGELSKPEVEALVTKHLDLLELDLKNSKLQERPDSEFGRRFAMNLTKKGIADEVIKDLKYDKAF